MTARPDRGGGAGLAWLTGLFAAVAVGITFGDGGLPGRFLLDRSFGADIYHLSTIYERTAHYLLSGNLPLWLPEFQGGYPAPAACMYGLLYPPVVLFGLVPAETAWSLLALAHVAIAGAGMFLFVHGMRRDALAAAVAAILVATGEFLVGRVLCGHLNLVMAFAWAPWVLHAARLAGGADPVAARARVRLALLVGVSLIAGHVQIAFYVLPLAALVATGQAFRTPGDGAGDGHHGGLRSLLGAAVPGLLLGGLLAAVQLVPAVELFSLADRSVGHVVPAQSLGAVLAEKLVPGTLGQPPDTAWVKEMLGHEYGAVAGLAPLFLALLGLVSARVAGDSLRWAWGALGVLGVLAALGDAGPLGPVMSALPVLSSARTPGRALLLTALAVGVLAGHGVADWRAHREGRGRRFALAAGGALLLLGASLAVLASHAAGMPAEISLPGGTRAPWQWLTALGGPALAASAAGLLLVAGALVWAARRPASRAAALALPAAALLCTFLGSAPTTSTVPADFFHHDWFAELPPGARDHRVVLPGERFPNVERLGGRTLREICYVDTPWFERYMRNPSGNLGWWMDVGVIAYPPRPREGADPRTGPWDVPVEPRRPIGGAVLFREAAGDTPDEAALAEMTSGREALFLAGSTGEHSDRPRPVLSHTPLDVERSGDPCRLVVGYRAPAAAWLFVSEKYYPGWEAYVDGDPVEIHRANVAFRAVRVPAGAHRVEMVYRPGSWRLGALLSLLAAVAAVLPWLLGRRRPPGPPAPESREAP